MSGVVPPGSKRHHLLICLLLLTVTLGLYWPVLSHDFINYDDPQYVFDNRRVLQGLNRSSIKWAFTALHASNWHPMTWLSHLIDVELYGLDPFGHHLTGLLFHAANTILLFLLFSFMTGALLRSAVIALLFAIHPLHVESVAWIAERKDVLSAFCFILTLLAYVCYVRKKGDNRSGGESGGLTRGSPAWVFYVVALAVYACGLMSKPMLVSLPFVLLLLDYWPLGRFSCPDGTIRVAAQEYQRHLARIVGEKIPFLAMALLSCWITLVAQSHGNAIISGGIYPIQERLLNIPVAYSWYLGKMFFPVDLATPYPFEHSHQLREVAGAVALITLLMTAVLYRARRQPYLLVGWLWFVVMLAPVSGVVQAGYQSYANRYTYLPSVGLFVVITWILSDFQAHRYHCGKVLRGCAVVTLVVLLVSTRGQLGFWKDSRSLFGRAVQLYPDNSAAWALLGDDWLRKGNFDQAIRCLERSLEGNSRFPGVWNNLGLARSARGDYQKAIMAYETAIRLAPDDADLHNNRAVALHDSGSVDMAIAEWREALRLDAGHTDSLGNLGDLMAERGDYEQAMRYYQKILEYDPGSLTAQAKLDRTRVAAKANHLQQQ